MAPRSAPDAPKQVVADGYDQIAPRYLAWRPRRDREVERLLALVKPGWRILDLGCGAGLPVTKALADVAEVIGVDLSAAQLKLAKQHVPSARFLRRDMTALRCPPASFDAVVSFYALIHVPREEQAPLLRRIYSWLRPGGLFYATMGTSDNAGEVEADFVGAPMYFSHYDAVTNRRLVREAGFELVESRVTRRTEDGRPVRFLSVTARRPS